MANQKHINELLSKALAQAASVEELLELAEMVRSDKDGEITRLIENMLQNGTTVGAAIPGRERYDQIVNSILAVDKTAAAGVEKPGTIFQLSRRMVAAAAIIIVLVGAGMFLWLKGPQKTAVAKKEQPSPLFKIDMPPGHNQAVLKLADGSTIVLDSAGTGILARQGNTRIQKLNNGQLAYLPSGTAQEPLLYNTIVTPRGGQYQLVLPDGSKVWLNAASSLRFPAKFTGAERSVELDGEGYFEVAKNAAMPFEVKIHGNTSVRVLGTHFNIMAYGDERAIKATLLEGMVKVSKGENTHTLSPGQQAMVDNGSNKLQIMENADLDEAIAWKNGYFQFTKIDSQAMRQISRWYDVDLVYETALKERYYTGRINRNVKLSNMADALKVIGLHCRIEQGKLVVMP